MGDDGRLGDGDTGPSVSFALAQQLLALPTTTSVASDCSRTFSANQPFTLQASIAGSSLGGVPGGSVDFVTDSGLTLCQTVALSAATARCRFSGVAQTWVSAVSAWLSRCSTRPWASKRSCSKLLTMVLSRRNTFSSA